MDSGDISFFINEIRSVVRDSFSEYFMSLMCNLFRVDQGFGLLFLIICSINIIGISCYDCIDKKHTGNK